MAKAILTFVDDEDGQASLTGEFDPPLQRDGAITVAQAAAAYALRFVQARAGGPEVLEDFLTEMIDEAYDEETDEG